LTGKTEKDLKMQTEINKEIDADISAKISTKIDADSGLTIAGKTYRSRLLVGSGKYKDLEQTRLATEAAGAEIITVAIRRVNIGQDPNAPSLLDAVPPSKYTILPNSAGCYNAADAVYTLQLGRELLGGHKLCKLEVLGDEKTLFPNMPETLKAAKTLVQDTTVRSKVEQNQLLRDGYWFVL
jgi:thiazole synthase